MTAAALLAAALTRRVHEDKLNDDDDDDDTALLDRGGDDGGDTTADSSLASVPDATGAIIDSVSLPFSDSPSFSLAVLADGRMSMELGGSGVVHVS